MNCKGEGHKHLGRRAACCLKGDQLSPSSSETEKRRLVCSALALISSEGLKLRVGSAGSETTAASFPITPVKSGKGRGKKSKTP